MRIALLSDTHSTSKIPRSRIGNPLNDFQDKMRFVFQYSQDNDISLILHSGDLFDSPRDIVALYAFLELTEEFSDIEFCTVFGQHDMYFRNKEVLTNLNLLKRSGVVEVLDKHPKIVEHVHIYGCSWGEEVPKYNTHSPLNILVIHAPIYKEMLFPGHEVYYAADFFQNHPFDLILCGDIHRRFIHKDENGIILNTGPMMRLEATNYNMKHIPKFAIYDTEYEVVKFIDIPCKPAEEVLDPKIKKRDKVKTNYDFKLNIKTDVDKIDMFVVIKKLLEQSDNKKGILKVMKKTCNYADFKEIQ